MTKTALESEAQSAWETFNELQNKTMYAYSTKEKVLAFTDWVCHSINVLNPILDEITERSPGGSRWFGDVQFNHV